MTKEETRDVLTSIIAANYSAYSVRSDTVDLWFKLLSGFRATDVAKAAVQHVQTSKFPPTASEILALLPSKDEARSETPEFKHMFEAFVALQSSGRLRTS